ncbi:DUF4870 domain-containing protein [Actinospongicola halichondriae]|uniref:DUF4870 domain-containing protein n=1 Tax=Actinospongicola halichondriae TaxID=3236844 RepID=UPI003D56B51D
MADDELPPPPPPPPSWGPPPAPTGGTDDRTLATLAHAGQIVGGFVVPLIIYLIKKDESPFVADQAREALNFSITVVLAMFVSFLLMLVLIGFLLFFVVMAGTIIFPILGAVAANRGEYYRYPICIRLVT